MAKLCWVRPPAGQCARSLVRGSPVRCREHGSGWHREDGGRAPPQHGARRDIGRARLVGRGRVADRHIHADHGRIARSGDAVGEVGMQRGGRKRAVLEPDEHPASRTSVDTGHDPHLRHAGTAAGPPAAVPAGPDPPMAPPIRVPETHGGGRPGSGIMVSEGLPPLTPLTAGRGGQPATPGRERRSTAYPGYGERGSDAHIHEDEPR